MAQTNLPAAKIANAALAARAALARSGAPMPADPPPACERCGGSGMIYPTSPQGAVDYSSSAPCDCQAEAIAQDSARRLAIYGNLPQERRADLSGIPEDAALAARRYAANPSTDLLICGPPGSGKSEISVAIARLAARQGAPALYMRAAEIFESGESPPSAADRACAAPLLVAADADDDALDARDAKALARIIERRRERGAPTAATAQSERLLHPAIAAALSGAKRLTLAPSPERASAAVPAAYQRCDLQNFNVQRSADPAVNARLLAALSAAAQYSLSPSGFLVITGPPASGKTHLAIGATVASARALKVNPIYLTCRQALARLRDSALRELPPGADIESAPLVAIDDFGEGASTAWGKDALAHLVKTRHAYALPTVIAARETALDPEKGVGASLIWRLTDPDCAARAALPPPDGDRRTNEPAQTRSDSQ